MSTMLGVRVSVPDALPVVPVFAERVRCVAGVRFGDVRCVADAHAQIGECLVAGVDATL